jgi:predicted unusual protein kinase regulating ubiquinone biosynthesis (AarF/ABC1/UbiB family)
LVPTFDAREAKPFAMGGFSDVYEATLDGRLVAIKTLRVTTTTDLEKLHRVSV